nr:unnamed protein product [Digitaria exilis]
MPRLERLEFEVHVWETREIASGCGGLEFGLGNLPSLQHVVVSLEAKGASKEEVTEVEAALEHATEIHPNHPTLDLHLYVP